MYIQWIRVLYSVVITRQTNPPISQFNRLCSEFTNVCIQYQQTKNNKSHVEYRIVQYLLD